MNADRRSALAAIGSVMALAGLGVPVRAAPRVGSVSFPHGPVRLRRVLERGLGEGASLTVTRIWECRFAAHPSGANIAARQIDVAVTAPKALAALAEAERRREVVGLFPMELDRQGAIVGWSGREIHLDSALAAARRAIESRDISDATKAEARNYVAAMDPAAADLVSQVPRDLFYPAAGERHENRAIDLPGGGKGSYELTVRARACPQSGLLESSERRIVTRIGASARTSREQWSIA